MSFETILIYRDFQTVNGYVQLSPNLESQKTSKSQDTVETNAISGLAPSLEPIVKRLSHQTWIRLPGVVPGSWHTDINGDYVDPIQDVL